MRNLVIAFSLLCISLTGLTFFVGVSKVQPRAALTSSNPHIFGNPLVSIKNIHLTVFYFVPQDKITEKQDSWKDAVELDLKKLQEFHSVQFSKKSKITYTVFPTPITGQKTTKEYGVSTHDDEPDALIAIKKEMEDRGFTNQKIDSIQEAHEVYLIVFEGEGGAGNGDFSLISRAYVTDKAFEAYSATFLAHEFYHTLGIPDHYEKSSYVYSDGQETTISLLKSKDIMGQVNIPLSSTYLDTATLQKMGM